MNEFQYKKKMQHFLEINNALYKENQVLKKALEYQENQNNILKEQIKNQEAFIDRQGILINELKKQQES